jgi:hypothetical protein
MDKLTVVTITTNIGFNEPRNGCNSYMNLTFLMIGVTFFLIL